MPGSPRWGSRAADDRQVPRRHPGRLLHAPNGPRQQHDRATAVSVGAGRSGALVLQSRRHGTLVAESGADVDRSWERFGKTNQDIDFAEQAWDFFQRHPSGQQAADQNQGYFIAVPPPGHREPAARARGVPFSPIQDCSGTWSVKVVGGREHEPDNKGRRGAPEWLGASPAFDPALPAGVTYPSRPGACRAPGVCSAERPADAGDATVELRRRAAADAAPATVEAARATVEAAHAAVEPPVPPPIGVVSGGGRGSTSSGQTRSCRMRPRRPSSLKWRVTPAEKSFTSAPVRNPDSDASWNGKRGLTWNSAPPVWLCVWHPLQVLRAKR